MHHKAAATRERILLAAAHEFDEHGYAGGSMRGIADRIGQSKGALGYHFQSKASIAAAIVERFYVQASTGDDGMDVRALVQLSLNVAGRFRDDVMARAAVRLQRDADMVEAPLPIPYVSWLALTETALVDAQRKGQLVPDLDVTSAARVLVAAFFGTQEIATTLGYGEALTDWVLKMWQVTLPGIVGNAAGDILADLEHV